MSQATIAWALGIAITGIPALYEAGTWVDGRYALQERLILVEQRLEEKIDSDKALVLQQRQWTLEDRYQGDGVPSAPPSVKEEYRQVRSLRERLLRSGGQDKSVPAEKAERSKADHQ